MSSAVSHPPVAQPRPRAPEVPVAGIPRVTVGMPVYNAAKWLRHSVGSILAQTFTDFELVISDNASTDDSFDIARELAETDKRIRLYRNPMNVGVNRNYSLLVGYARGEYFKWASSSDLCDPTFIEKCVRVLDTHADIGLCSSRTKLFAHSPAQGTEYAVSTHTVDEDPLARFYYVLEHVALNNAINGLIRMSLLRRTALIRPYYSSDIILLAEIALRSKLFELPEFLFFRRFDQESATALQDALRVQRFHFPTPGPGMRFQRWKRCWGHVSAINHADLTLPQRLAGLKYVAKTWYWALPDLYADVREAVGAMTRRSGR